MTTPIYDSAAIGRPVLQQFINIWRYRGLLRLLITRDLTTRYKRSVLGVWWTLLNPLLTAAVLWVVFSSIFRFPTPGVPYIVYLLSGVTLVTFFSQAVLACSGSIVHSASLLSRVYVPPELFAISAAAAASVNFAIAMVPLLIVQVITGVGVPATAILVPLLAVAVSCLAAGLGLMVAALAVRFRDILDLVGVLLQLISYLTPAFYPLAIVPQHLQLIIKMNPVYAYLTVLRTWLYVGSAPPTWAVLVVLVTSVGSLMAGVWIFTRSWRRSVGAL